MPKDQPASEVKWSRTKAVRAGVLGVLIALGADGLAQSALAEGWAGKPPSSVPTAKPLAVPDAPGGPKVKTVAALAQAHDRLLRLVKFANAAAERADSEKFVGAGSLFRAASRSQSVQAGLLRAELARLGQANVPAGADGKAADGKAGDGKAGEGKAGESLEVKTTLENLKTALAAAMALKDSELPAWRREADGEGNREAVRVLRWAREGQIELSRYFKDAGDGMESLKGGKRAYFVSKTCGFTLDKLDVKRCPVCNAERDDFERVD